MGKLGELVVRIGADTRDLNKALGRVQRNVRSMSSNLQSLGQTVTRNVTLPLAAFGAAAIKSAADLEQLETSFVSLTGGAEEAAFMMQRLNEFTAKTPFQIDAVAKSARQLIASGTDISQVNEQLQFLGDIAATSGSSIDEIAAIFSKVQAKGKVELESLNQLAERGVPIFKALSDATGLPAEKLGAGRVSVEQFNQVLKGFAEEGGFAAGAMDRLSQTTAGKFSTALDNVKIALASLGELFLPVITRLLDGIVALAQQFTALSPVVKRIAVVVGTFVGAIGPLLIIAPQLIGVFAALRTATIGLNIAMAANPALLVAAGIAALTAAVVGYHMDVGTAVQTTNDWRVQLLALNNENKKVKLEENIEAATEALEEHTGVLDRFRQLRDAAQLPSEQKKWQDAMDSHQQIIDQINGELVAYNTELENVEASLTQAANAQNAMNAASQGGVDTLGKLFSQLEEVQVKTTAAQMSMGQFFSMLENVEVQVQNVAQAGKTMGETLANSIGNAVGQAQSFAGVMVEVARAVVVAYLAQTKAKILQNSAEGASGTGPAYPFVMAGLLTAGMALMNRIQIPALAQGGLAYGPTTALVGDNRNARIDPEVIAPLSKLKDMMGGNRVEVVGRIKGDDIFLSNARNRATRNRLS